MALHGGAHVPIFTLQYNHIAPSCRVRSAGDLLLLDLGPGSSHSQALQARPLVVERLRGVQQQVGGDSRAAVQTHL